MKNISRKELRLMIESIILEKSGEKNNSNFKFEATMLTNKTVREGLFGPTSKSLLSNRLSVDNAKAGINSVLNHFKNETKFLSKEKKYPNLTVQNIVNGLNDFSKSKLLGGAIAIGKNFIPEENRVIDMPTMAAAFHALRDPEYGLSGGSIGTLWRNVKRIASIAEVKGYKELQETSLRKLLETYSKEELQKLIEKGAQY